MRRHADTTPPTGREAEKTLAEAQLAALVQWSATHTEAVARLSARIVNDCVLTELITFPATGYETRSFGTSIGAVAVDNHSAAANVIVAAGPAVGDASATRGVGRGRINAGKARTLALTGPVVTFWGTPGEQITVQVFTKAVQPGSFG